MFSFWKKRKAEPQPAAESALAAAPEPAQAPTPATAVPTPAADTPAAVVTPDASASTPTPPATEDARPGWLSRLGFGGAPAPEPAAPQAPASAPVET